MGLPSGPKACLIEVSVNAEDKTVCKDLTDMLGEVTMQRDLLILERR